jgi:hypothetical protein
LEKQSKADGIRKKKLASKKLSEAKRKAKGAQTVKAQPEKPSEAEGNQVVTDAPEMLSKEDGARVVTLASELPASWGSKRATREEKTRISALRKFLAKQVNPTETFTYESFCKVCDNDGSGTKAKLESNKR